MAQDQDGHGDAVKAQLHSFVDAADSQIVRTQLLQMAGNLHGAMAVSIGFHHT